MGVTAEEETSEVTAESVEDWETDELVAPDASDEEVATRCFRSVSGSSC